MPIYVGHDIDTGRPFGAVFSPDAKEAAKNWAACEVLEIEDDTLPDLTDKWVVGGAIVERDQVKDQAALDAMAAEKATQAKAATLAELIATDGPLIRVIEDLVNTLVSKKVIALDDLPAVVRDKLTERENLRVAYNA